MIHVHFVLGRGRVEGAELQKKLDGPLVFGDGDAPGAFTFEFNGFLSVSYR